MLEERVPSKLFVGRKRELDKFQSLLTSESKISILNIHANGDGGIGKTQLLLRMQEYSASVPDVVVFAKELIDFYHTETRSKLGVMRQIAANLCAENFPEFETLIQEFQSAEDISARQELFPKVENAFRRNYASFATEMKRKKKVIVLFFDTYEFIQGAELPVTGQKQTEPTGFSRWVETQLFPHISENTRLIVSGRYPLQDIQQTKLSVEEINLSHFDLSDTIVFWKKCFHIETDEELVAKIGSNAFIEAFHSLADGRPILLALFAEWVNYSRNPFSPGELLNKIKCQTGKTILPVTEEQKQLFERAMIERVASLIKLEDRVVTYMAVAYRRMTPEMFHFLVDIPFNTCQEILLEKLKPLSFIKYQNIKYKREDIILLHDEMRRLIVQYWWNAQDANRSIRKEIAEKLVRYYNEKFLTSEDLLEVEREKYTPELLEYAFLANPLNGLQHFGDEFDIALENGRYDYSDLLSREAVNYHGENPDEIPFPHFLEIDCKRIQYYNATNKNYEKSLERIETILRKHRGDLAWENSIVYGHFLVERGIAECSLEKFEESIQSFQTAEDVFKRTDENKWLYRTYNWIGYAYLRRGEFDKAEEYLTRSRDGIYDLLIKQKPFTERERRQLLQGMQLSLGNLAVVYSYTGRFQKAIHLIEIVLNIVRHLPRNNLEIARAYKNLGHVFAFIGHPIKDSMMSWSDARQYLKEAEKLLEDIENRLITGCAKADLGFLEYRINKLAYPLEYYRAEEIRKIIKEIGTQEKTKKRYEYSQYGKYGNLKEAKMLIKEAIELLGKEPAIKKELADAYYNLGELYMVMPSKSHWQEAEKAFLESCKLGKESQFRYRVFDTLESLVTLYYVWNDTLGKSEKAEQIKKQNLEKMNKCKRDLEKFERDRYPDPGGKYELTLGNIEFDEALELLKSENESNLDSAKRVLEEAFKHYVFAATLMKRIHEDRYYLTLRIIYNRLNLLVDKVQKKQILSQFSNRLNKLRSFLETQAEEFEELKKVCKYNYLNIQPRDNQDNIDELKKQVQKVENTNNFGLAALLNNCLIESYKSLISPDKKNDEYREQLILQLNAQSRFYRILGYEDQAIRYLDDAKKELKCPFSDLDLKEALGGYTDSTEGVLKYRIPRGEYMKPLEFYLQDELPIARRNFDKQFPGLRENALTLLHAGKNKLENALSSFWKNKREDRKKNNVPEKELYPLKRILEYHQKLDEARFRIGELLMLNEQFEDHKDENGALSYLKRVIDESKNFRDYYWFYAMQTYINVLYLSGNYDHPKYSKDRGNYENCLKENLTSFDPILYPSIMGRLRIVQGNALFSSYFQRKETPASKFEEYQYKHKAASQILQRMLHSYVEACNFMAQHDDPTYFDAAVRILQRRIRLISDRQSLQMIQSSLQSIWDQQEHLKKKDEERDMLIQFATIRSIMLEDEKNR